MEKETTKVPTIPEVMAEVGDLRVMSDDLIPHRFEPGGGRACLVLGDNATGKSLVRRLLSHKYKDRGVEAIPLSMEGRAGGGMFGMKGFVYGDEDWKSTGHNSIGTFEGMVRTSRGREKPHMVYLDEPDTGLSDRWARSLGRALADFLADPPEHLAALFVTTHRVCLARELLRVSPHALLVGPGWPATLDDWFAGDPREPEPIAALGERGIALFRRIGSECDKRLKEQAEERDPPKKRPRRSAPKDGE